MCMAESLGPIQKADKDIEVYKVLHKDDQKRYIPIYYYPNAAFYLGVTDKTYDDFTVEDYERSIINIENGMIDSRCIGYHCFRDISEAEQFSRCITLPSFVLKFIILKGVKYRVSDVDMVSSKYKSLILASQLVFIDTVE